VTVTSSEKIEVDAAVAVKRVGIIGAGQMGNGIAHVVALGGYEVAVNDLDPARYDAAIQTVTKNLTRQVTRGLITEGDMEAALGRISFAPTLATFETCDLIIEAVPERPELKEKINRELADKGGNGFVPARLALMELGDKKAFKEIQERLTQAGWYKSNVLHLAWAGPKQAKAAALRKRLETTHTAEGSLAKWLRRPESSWAEFPLELRAEHEPEIWDLVEIDVKYEGYIRRQDELVSRTRRADEALLPPDLDYQGITGLKLEARAKLQAIRPRTLGQAGRVSGITPADLALVLVHLKVRSG
jgi:hypothetical protein